MSGKNECFPSPFCIYDSLKPIWLNSMKTCLPRFQLLAATGYFTQMRENFDCSQGWKHNLTWWRPSWPSPPQWHFPGGAVTSPVAAVYLDYGSLTPLCFGTLFSFPRLVCVHYKHRRSSTDVAFLSGALATWHRRVFVLAVQQVTPRMSSLSLELAFSKNNVIWKNVSISVWNLDNFNHKLSMDVKKRHF